MKTRSNSKKPAATKKKSAESKPKAPAKPTSAKPPPTNPTSPPLTITTAGGGDTAPAAVAAAVVSPVSVFDPQIAIATEMQQIHEAVEKLKVIDRELLNVSLTTPDHARRCTGYLNEIIEVIKSPKFDGVLTHAMRDSVYDDDLGVVPRVVLSLGGELTRDKCRLASSILYEWISNRKPVRKTSSGHYEPNTLIIALRTILGFLKHNADWRFALNKDFAFDGGLNPLLNKLFRDRYDELAGQYGRAPNRARLNGCEDVKEINFAELPEDTADDMTNKMLFGMGLFSGLRGNSEHTNLLVSNIEKGTFESGHPLAGEEFYALQNMPSKTVKLTVTNTILPEENRARTPVNSVFGQFITRYLGALSPGQIRLYCKPATDAQKRRFAAMGFPGAMFSPIQPIGKNSVLKKMKETCAKMGLPSTSGHALRRLFITTLANDSSVNIQ